MKLEARPSFVGDEPTTDIIDKHNGNITVATDVEEDYLELFLRVSSKKVGASEDINFCPTCDIDLETKNKQNFCSNCGQKLDWEGAE